MEGTKEALDTGFFRQVDCLHSIRISYVNVTAVATRYHTASIFAYIYYIHGTVISLQKSIVHSTELSAPYHLPMNI